MNSRRQRVHRGRHLGLAFLVTLAMTFGCGSTGRPSAATSRTVSTSAPGVTGSISQGTSTAIPSGPTTTPAPTTAATTVGSVPIGVATGGTPDIPGPGSCHAEGVLSDHLCTPGATNPAVTSADLSTTICATGWATTVRPPESYT